MKETMNLIELVPRTLEGILEEGQDVLTKFPFINGINVPDVHRLSVRSVDAASGLLKNNMPVVPHIRCIDFPVAKTLEHISKLVDEGLRQVLIVTGDPPIDHTKAIYDVSPLDVISEIKESFPNLSVYAALDPYRQNIQNELKYCRLKLKAGADGFFTQPFFDVQFARIFLDQLEGCEVYLGISPVTSEKSQNYWITRNKAIFPKGFNLSLEANCIVAKQLMALAKKYHQHTYHMPIKVSAATYLSALQQIGDIE